MEANLAGKSDEFIVDATTHECAHFCGPLGAGEIGHAMFNGARAYGLLALQLGADSARDVAMAALSEGLLINDVAPSVLRFCPPLTIGEAECDEALDILAKVLRGTPS